MQLKSDKQHHTSDPLQDSEALLRAMIENLPGGAAFVVDPDLRYRLAEGEVLSAAGFKPEDLVGHTIFEVLPPDLATSYEVLYRKGLAGEPFEHEHNAHDRFYISRGTPLRSANGEVYAVLAVSYDITDRKRAEDERKRIEAAAALDLEDMQRLRELSARLLAEDDIQTLYQEIVATAIALARADAGSIQILDEATQQLVMLANQGAGQKLTEHFYRVNADSNTPCGMALTTGKRTFVDFDVPESEDPDGSLRLHVEEGYFSAQSTPLINRSGKAIGMVSIHWRKHHRPTDCELRFLDLLARQAADLIEQRQAQVALRESEERFRTLANTAPALIWYNDAQGNNLFINQHFLDFTGKSAEQIRGEGWHELVHPDEAELYIADYLAAVREQRSWHNRNRIRRHDGVWRWHDNYAKPLFSADGVYLGHVGVTIDNTDAIEAEIALRESEEKFRTFVSVGSDIIYEMSADWREMRSLKGKEFVATTENLRRDWTEAYIPEADRPQVRAAISRAITTRSNFELEHRVIRLDGTVGWTFSRAIPLLNETGEIVKWFGAASDITEQKHAEEALRASEEKYRSLFQSMDEGFAVVEVMADDNGEWNDFLFLEVNPAFERQTGIVNSFGRKATEILGTPNPAWAQVYGRVAETGEPVRFEQKEETLDRIFDLYAFRLGEAGSRCVAVIFNDITDRKYHEQRQAFLLQLSDALRSLSDAVEIHATVTRIAMNLFGADRCYYCEMIDGNAIIRRDASREDLPSVAGVYPLSSFPILKTVVDAGHPFVVEDAHTTDLLDESLRQLCCESQVISFLNVPVIKDGKPTGVLCITQTTARKWTALETELAQETAERIWAAVERARAETSLRESEAKYRSLFESMNEGLAINELVRDESGRAVDARYLELNPAFERQTGFDRSSTLGRLASEVFPNYYRPWLEIVERVVRTRQPERFEHFVPDNEKWFAFQVTPFGGADGFTVLYHDITERKHAEEQLRRAAEMDAFRVMLSDALRSLSDPVEIQSVAMRVLGEQLQVDRVLYAEVERDDETLLIHDNYVNHDVPKIVGQFRISDFPQGSRKLRAGQCAIISDVTTDPELTELDRASYAALSIRATIVVPLIKGGRWAANMGIYHTTARVWSEDDIVLLEESAQRTWAAVERARAEDALRESEIQRIREQTAHEEERQRAETLAELDRAKTLFFSNVSHEFRTPLTLLLAPLQDALSDHTLPPVHRDRLQLAHRNSLRLLKLVNTLLDFSRIEAGRMEAVYEPTDLAQLTTELASVFHSAIDRAGLRLIVDCPPLPPVYVDREMWEKIVLNLLSNAFKFTFEGEIRVNLRSIDGNQAVLQIQDTGTGIAPQHLPHLFERFYQVRGTQARTHEGSGIGLALVHELVRLQGGTIEVSSTLGEGTCFTIALPFGTEHLPSDRLHLEGDRQPVRTLTSTAIGAAAYVEEARWLPTEENQERIEEEPIPSSDSLLPAPASARVLLVDDNTDMREYLTRILSEHVQVEAVADGATALAVAQDQVPNLILSDVMMPGLDGFELLQALRSNPRTREVPIILLSARAGEEAIVEGLEAGADDYLIKPFSAQELVSRVTAHLQMTQLRAEALQEAKTTIRSRDEFISVVSHELNTPLVSILGWTRLLRSNSPSPAMLTKALDTIERNATLQAKLVQDLLDTSRITAGKLRLNLQPIELPALIETVIATVAQTAAAKNIHLTWQKNCTGPVVVMGDHDRLQQVVCNLLTNAIKFTPESGSVTLELSVIDDDHSTDGSYAEVRVIDTGIGIAADFLSRVFDRFRQAKNSDAEKGLGLGLAIARHIVELHNGTIHAESAGKGQGATFTVRLPLLTASAQ